MGNNKIYAPYNDEAWQEKYGYEGESDILPEVPRPKMQSGVTSVTSDDLSKPADDLSVAQQSATKQATILENETPSERYSRKATESLNRFNKAIADGRSPYQEFLKSAMQKNVDSAKRRERDARTLALANAFGSLVNIITAGAIASKNDTIPIVAEFDKTPDANLRKAIEGRYAMENENENLLMKLMQEQRRYDEGVAKNQYETEMKQHEQEYNAAIKAAERREKEERKEEERAIANEEWNRRQAIRQQDAIDLAIKKGEIRANAEANGGKPKPKPFKYDKAKIDQFVAEATTWDYEEDHPVIKGRKVKKTHTSKPSSAESSVAEQVAKYCQENKVSDNVTSVLSEVYRKLFQTIKPEVTKKFGNDLTKSIISAIKAGRNADEAYNVAKTYIEENK